MKKDQGPSEMLLKQLNDFRRNPQSIIPALTSRKDHYNKKNMFFSMNHPHKSIQTIEGSSPINPLISFLLNEHNLSQLQEHHRLTELAESIASDYKQCTLQSVVFTQEKATKLRKELDADESYSFPDKVICVIGVGWRNQDEPLLSLLIDDGDQYRRNRKAIMSQGKYVGIGSVAIGDDLICAVYLISNNINHKLSEN